MFTLLGWKMLHADWKQSFAWRLSSPPSFPFVPSLSLAFGLRFLSDGQRFVLLSRSSFPHPALVSLPCPPGFPFTLLILFDLHLHHALLGENTFNHSLSELTSWPTTGPKLWKEKEKRAKSTQRGVKTRARERKVLRRGGGGIQGNERAGSELVARPSRMRCWARRGSKELYAQGEQDGQKRAQGDMRTCRSACCCSKLSRQQKN